MAVKLYLVANSNTLAIVTVDREQNATFVSKLTEDLMKPRRQIKHSS